KTGTAWGCTILAQGKHAVRSRQPASDIQLTKERNYRCQQQLVLRFQYSKRAVEYYSKVLVAEIPIMGMTKDMGSFLGMIPDRGGKEGSLVNLHLDCKLEAALEKATAAGGEALLPKAGLGDEGFTAFIRDTGNNLEFPAVTLKSGTGEGKEP
ncbi:MAG: VOC family protein, partial [Anaerolineales bacterium]